MNRQGPGKISWTDYTWNPIKGKCPVGCKIPGTDEIYCYGHDLYNRFDWLNEGTVPDSLIPGMVAEWELDAPRKLKKPSKIFVCSTYEIFYHKHHSWRDDIFATIEACPQHTFQILTKMPENIDRPMPDNVWLGVSITGEAYLHKIVYLDEAKAKTKFVSFEPLLDLPAMEKAKVEFAALDWVIIGRLTGHGNKFAPIRPWIDHLKSWADRYGIPIFLKDNLKEIWGGELIQEWPE